MDTKALIIDTNSNGKLQGNLGAWEDATTQMGRVTPNIITPDVQNSDDIEATSIAAAVSGMPTPFARPTLFARALASQNSGSGISSGLAKYYASLVDEWRGLIACLALDAANGKLSVDTIELAYSDGKEVSQTANVLEPKGAFGNMLLDKRSQWCDQKAANMNLAKPRICIIKYNGMVVGGTSPDVLLFTAPKYQIDEPLAYVNPKTHRFTDPQTLGRLTQDQWLALDSYLHLLMGRFQSLNGYFIADDNKPDYTNLQAELQKWTSEVDAKVSEKNFDKSNASPLPVNYFTIEPFKSFFNYSDNLFAINGVIFSQEQEHAQAFSPDELLLPNDVELVNINIPLPATRDLSSYPLTVLRATKKESTGFSYFALPLSETGIRVFEKNMDTLLGLNPNASAVGSSLVGEFDERANTLKVTLTIKTKEGTVKPITVNYRVSRDILQNKDVIIWPNFASAQWNRYFLYSEMPHNDHSNDCPFESVPFCGDNSTPSLDIITTTATTQDEEEKIAVLAVDGKAKSLDGKLTAKLDVFSDYRTSDQRYKYEIYEADKPFRGVEIKRMGKVCGFFLIRYSTQQDNHILPYNYAGIESQLNDVSLGIDFGSTNTSIAYYSDMDGKAKGFDFHNHRISLLQCLHTIPEGKLPTMESSVFFFQRNTMRSNTVKSILTLHDPRRLPEGNIVRQEAVSGGLPCFSRDLPINVVKDGHISLLFRNTGTIADLVNNMKWRGDDQDKEHKSAFLSSLLLHVYAELFAEGRVPVELKWSYPSSMGETLLMQYSQVWDSLSKISPVEGKNLTVSKKPGGRVDFGDSGKNAFADALNDVGGDPFGSASFPGGDAFSAQIQDNSTPFGGGDSSDPFGAGTSSPFEGGASSDPFSGGNSDPFGGGDPFGNNTGGGFGGFGSTQPKVQKKVEDLKPDDGPIEFKIEPLKKGTSLTEACAVANYIVGTLDSRVLTLCFDIGGSTTDISAICVIKGSDGQIHPTLIKQSSVRFAAQRVSGATAYLSNQFKKVLLDTCQQFGIKMTGLNFLEDKYSASTASYFYEQIVDLLPKDQLPAFYQKIAADCRDLFSVNLYVTGLIMYYAGQITEKLIKEIRRAKDGLGENWKTFVDIKFVGKGSRIFDWLSVINNNVAQQYCREQFVHGMGGMQAISQMLNNWPHFNLRTAADLAGNDIDKSEVKYEVAKGLAMPVNELYVPQDNVGIEILGEEGFSIVAASTGKSTPLQFDNSITPQMMEQLGKYFMAPTMGQPCKRFIDFAGVFYKYASHLFELKMTQNDFMTAFRNMSINSYIQNQPEFRAAKNRKDGSFDYVNPIIILEGMKFYEEYLLKGIAEK
jgi:hypothetical protein